MSRNAHESSTTGGGDLARLREMVKEIDFCMLTTIDERGDPHSRPMSTNKQIDFDGDLWFFTYGSSHKAIEIRQHPKVNASFADPSNQNWVSMTGTAELVRDRAKLEEFWQPQLKAWFPKGLDEPDIALLKVNVEKAEYWDSPSSTIAHVYSLASALVTGQQADLGDNKKLDLRVLSSGRGETAYGARVGSGMTGGGYQYEYKRPQRARGGRRARRGGDVEDGGGAASSVLSLLGGAALGATLKYFYDQQRGATSRRADTSIGATDLPNDAGRR